jgi:ribosomal protein S18 acetylase RimI-like enzyme
MDSYLNPPRIAKQEFEILEATWRDLGGVRRIEQECFGRDAWPLLEILAALSLPGNVHLKAVVGNEIVGYLGGEIKGSERTGWITTIGVAVVNRRMGIGVALLKAGEEKLATHKLRLCVRQSNLSALFMYWKSGYHQVDVWKNYYLGSEDALVLEKEV